MRCIDRTDALVVDVLGVAAAVVASGADGVCVVPVDWLAMHPASATTAAGAKIPVMCVWSRRMAVSRPRVASWTGLPAHGNPRHAVRPPEAGRADK